jgi:hypothetical protein
MSASGRGDLANSPGDTINLAYDDRMQCCDSVMLIGFGGPTAPIEVRPFLDRVLQGRPVPRERYEEVAMTTARLDWYGCATFRLTLGEQMIFLDAYIDRVPTAPGTGLRADDIERADWIVVGHSHFDHQWGAERIAKRTGATIIGSHETARIMEQAGVPLAQLLPVAGGERVRLAPEITVSVYPALHSCV